jgi:hypothetical protein
MARVVRYEMNEARGKSGLAIVNAGFGERGSRFAIAIASLIPSLALRRNIRYTASIVTAI